MEVKVVVQRERWREEFCIFGERETEGTVMGFKSDAR